MSACAATVPPAAIVGYSGMLVVPEDVNPDAFAAEINARPPVLLIHGDQDDLIPVQAMFHAAQGLAALEIPAEWHISTASATASTRKACATAANFWPANSLPANTPVCG